jgi:CubicO group peptidase (beta-lactamase class C family)
MNEIEQILAKAIADKAFPGAAAAWGDDKTTHVAFQGRTRYDAGAPAVDGSVLWDMASVTKVASTTSTALVMHHAGELDLDASAQAYASRFAHAGPTVRDLLLHRSGLPAYANFQSTCRSPEESEDALYALAARQEAPAATVYSCMGFMMLQRVIESITGESLAEAAQRRVFGPLGMTDTLYVPGPEHRTRCAPTEEIPVWRREIEDERGFVRVQDEFIQGGVHDPAAFMVGGVSGNAGLFSTIGDMAKWAQHMAQGGGSVIDPHTLGIWRRRQSDESTRALGFDTKSPKGSSAGELFGRRSFGHTGYTGTSVWMDPDTARWGVLLTSRVHPKDGNTAISQVRPQFYDAVIRHLA